jgi:hypothetical protein
MVGSMNAPEVRGRWPRLVLTIPPEAMQGLRELAAGNLRDPKREALRLVLDGLEREKPRPAQP